MFVSRFAFPEQGGVFAAAALNLQVEAVEADIGLAADEPFCKGQVPLQNAVPLLEEVEVGSDFGPIAVGIGERTVVQLVVAIERIDMGLFGKVRGRREAPLLVHDGFNVGGFGHAFDLRELMLTVTAASEQAITCRRDRT